MRKYALVLLKVVIVAGCLWYIYDRMLHFRMAYGPIRLLQIDWALNPVVLVVCMVIIALLNWAFEAQKWRVLFSSEFQQSLGSAMKTVLLALAGGILTPGKVGEYGARAMLVPQAVRWLAVGRQWLNTYGQTLITSLVAGIPAAIYLTMVPEAPAWAFWTFLGIWLALQYPAYLLYRDGGEWLARLIPAAWSNWMHRIPSGSQLSSSVLHANLRWALLRYVTYSVGNILIWFALGIHPNILLIACVVQANFILSIIIPVASILSIVVRSGTAIALAEPLGMSPDKVLLASFLNWAFQTLLPLMAGLLLLIKHPIKR
ncbi:MAG: hypothetical protein J4F31_07285 [Flavobacteriales bacterium]|nr:hypothetical protein [Flavobacteriales bacterium]